MLLFILLLLLLAVLLVFFVSTQLSDSRSSLSEGQLRGSFSDGELLRLTPRGRHALEDGELPPPPPPPPARQGVRSEADTVVGGSSAGRNWSRGGDPRQHLTLLMSAHPRLKANRASARGGRRKISGAAATVRGVGGSGDGRRRVARPREPLLGVDTDEGVSRRVLPGSFGGAGEERFSEEFAVYETGGVCRGDDDGSALSDGGCSLEPGQARPPMRNSWQEKVSRTRAGVGGVSSSRGDGGGGEQFGPGASWLRHRDVAASEDTAYSSGEASSEAEQGETPAAFFEQHLDDFEADEEGREQGPASQRPLKALTIGVGSSETRRWVATGALPHYSSTVNVESSSLLNVERIVRAERNRALLTRSSPIANQHHPPLWRTGNNGDRK